MSNAWENGMQDTKFYQQACKEFNEQRQLCNIAWIKEELTPQEYSSILQRAQQLKKEANENRQRKSL